MTTFINIHALISHPSSMMNRDDSGLQKTAILGGETRARISSQCLKRAIRTSDIYKSSVDEVSIRTNKFDELLERCIEMMPDNKPELIESVLLNMGSKVKSDKDKETKKVTRTFDAVQPYSIGAIREMVNHVEAGEDVKKLKKAEKIPTLDVSLSGRMDASCTERNVEAAMSVAHSLTTHAANIEVDWFTACDDLSEQGSGHIGSTEFSSGVFYRYATINLDLLSESTGKSKAELKGTINMIVRCFAQVSPSAKQKTFAAYNVADFIMITQADQPLSLANAFRTAVKNDGKVMETSITKLVEHYEKTVDGFDLNSVAKAFDMTGTLESDEVSQVSKIKELSFS
ncbi:MAG: type I-E CRISPR-associated protein Cas7/Cse4/CasC [Cycloclasticus sp.]|nr:MAG: type I-E CRISPR-associated protein Cas7/Cse4/CasC [Cycloclasticus sp.]